MNLPKLNDRIRILVGVFKDREGKVTSLAPKALKSIGVYVEDENLKVATVWFKPDEIEIL